MIQRVIYEVYVPFVIAFVGIAVPMVSLLLSIFSQGREEVAQKQREDIEKMGRDIQANEVSRQHSYLKLFFQLTLKRYKLLLLNPFYYLPLLTLPPITSVVFVVLAGAYNSWLLLSIAGIFIAVFFLLLWSLVIIIADITSRREATKTEQERSVTELLQNIFQSVDPKSSKLQNYAIKIDSTKISNDVMLPTLILGKETSWEVWFINSSNDIPAKRVELGIRFPLEYFEVKQQSGYRVYEPDNITRFNEEYIDQKTSWRFGTRLILTAKLTGKHKIIFWVKGENIEAKYFPAYVTVEVEA